MSNAERFLAAYEPLLLAAMQKSPADYSLNSPPGRPDIKDKTPEEIVAAAKSTAKKMVDTIAGGKAVNVSTTMKAAAKKLGIAPRVKDIEAFIRGGQTGQENEVKMRNSMRQRLHAHTKGIKEADAQQTKVALIRDPNSAPIGSPGKLTYRCPCGQAPQHTGQDVTCDCGRTYDARGYIKNVPTTPVKETLERVSVSRLNRMVLREMKENLDAHVQEFMKQLQALMDKHHKAQNSHGESDKLELMKGRKYWRISRKREGGGGSCYCFIDTDTGDVLKCASWKAPAKHARGNVYNPDHGIGAMGPYGTNYLKGGGNYQWMGEAAGVDALVGKTFRFNMPDRSTTASFTIKKSAGNHLIVHDELTGKTTNVPKKIFQDGMQSGKLQLVTAPKEGAKSGGKSMTDRYGPIHVARQTQPSAKPKDDLPSWHDTDQERTDESVRKLVREAVERILNEIGDDFSDLPREHRSFISAIEGKFGWSVAEQAADLLRGVDPEELNDNALRYIEQFAERHSENAAATEILDILSGAGV